MFEVTAGGPVADRGAIGVAIEIQPNAKYVNDGGPCHAVRHIALQLLSGIGAMNTARHADGWAAGVIHEEILRPLTPAAREMLKLVRRG